MPTYEYQCETCGHFEVVQKITEPALTTCPTCGEPVKRLVSAPAFHLKGSGWYKTDYASKNGSSSAASATSGAKTAETTESSSSGSSSESTPSAPASGSKGGSDD